MRRMWGTDNLGPDSTVARTMKEVSGAIPKQKNEEDGTYKWDTNDTVYLNEKCDHIYRAQRNWNREQVFWSF